MHLKAIQNNTKVEESWSDDSVVKNRYWTCRGPEFISQHAHLMAHNHG